VHVIVDNVKRSSPPRLSNVIGDRRSTESVGQQCQTTFAVLTTTATSNPPNVMAVRPARGHRMDRHTGEDLAGAIHLYRRYGRQGDPQQAHRCVQPMVKGPRD
jgi:hypothetical protein